VALELGIGLGRVGTPPRPPQARGAPGGRFQFQAAVSFAVGDGPEFVAVADFDGDTRPDLVTANNTSDDVTVLFNLPEPADAVDALLAGGNDVRRTCAAQRGTATIATSRPISNRTI